MGLMPKKRRGGPHPQRTAGEPLRGRAKAGKRKRLCTVCHRRCWYTRRCVRPLELVDAEGVRVPLAMDAVVCDACVARNPEQARHLVALDVAADDELAPQERRRRQTCRVCSGGGCRRCDGRGSIEVPT